MHHWIKRLHNSVLAGCLLVCTSTMAVSSLSVPFTIENFIDVAHPQVYVQGGIPLPQAKVQPNTAMRVTANDEAVEAEVKVSAFWPDGSVKWVLVRMQRDVTPKSTQSFELVCSEIPAPTPAPPFAHEDADRINVDTGVLRFSVNKTAANLFEQVSILNKEDWTPLLDSPEQSGLFMDLDRRTTEGETSIHFEANQDTKQFVATLEEASPLQTVIRLEGIHVSESGEAFAPYTVRLYAHKGSSKIRLVHNFIFDGEAREDFIRAIGVQLNLPKEVVTGYTFGTDRGYGAYTQYLTDPSLPAWRRGVLAQNSAQNFTITKVINPETNSTLGVREGTRSQGWGQLETTTSRISVGIKNFWQEFPKAIEMDAQDRSIKAYFYSPYAEQLDLRRYSDLGYHALYEAGAGPAGKPASPFNHDKYNASYISKSSELFLDFSPATTKVATAATALISQRPPLLRASTEWMASTQALGPVLPLAQLPHENAQAYYKTCMNLLMDEQEYRNWYSFIDYGDAMHSFNPGMDTWRYDQGGYAWMNNEGQLTGAYWMAYLTTGDERAYRFAEAMTKHVQDVDMFQAGPMAGRGMRHNVNHWGCIDRERRMTIPFNKRIYYFLSGDEHTRDRIHFIYNELTKVPGHFAAMDFSVGATALLFLWETTGDQKKYGVALQQAAETFCSNPVGGYGYPASLTLDITTGKGSVKEGVGMLPDYFLMFFGPMRILMETEALTDSEEIKASILNWATLLLMPEEEAKKLQLNFAAGTGGSNSHMQVAAYAYTHTQDPQYLNVIRAAYSDPTLKFTQAGGTGPLDRAPHLKIASPNSFQSNSIAITLFNYPFGAAALAQGEAKTE